MDYTLEQLSDMDPRELQPGDRVCMKVVAVVGYVHDWAAYGGEEDETVEEVAANGDKLSAEAAEGLFRRISYAFRYRG